MKNLPLLQFKHQINFCLLCHWVMSFSAQCKGQRMIFIYISITKMIKIPEKCDYNANFKWLSAITTRCLYLCVVCVDLSVKIFVCVCITYSKQYTTEHGILLELLSLVTERNSLENPHFTPTNKIKNKKFNMHKTFSWNFMQLNIEMVNDEKNVLLHLTCIFKIRAF